MAVVTKRECDVYKTAEDVHVYRVVIQRWGLANKSISTEDVTEWLDLSPKAKARLRHAVNGALCPPATKAESHSNRWFDNPAQGEEATPDEG